ncbi:endolysin [Arthrobacter phage CastorTray]|uniref:N-acetylmuramoyl-L-alanine amidase n=6 Tax=Gordonvirus TaxID=1982152 RepID=A0A2Z5HF94_9CAUD|nr:lysin A [Arthrobacter phage Breylor17]YP_010750102.1 lysin A [Arthrobacter phage Synepsis]YP_010750187.1 endolysin [Arthrobacter phage CastorTray]YP_010750279.1 lysin A [Arthrobacter phage Tatanka]YP_010750364.1 endolysin [Arthrobacter phage Trustiboi]YP_010750636.1 endolysin [Arthrobacter phage ScienceWizSam]AXC38630.1 lysin A [Arthrobacter phage Tatanka]AXH43748.1 lysin A [Arthrobacter phage Breylor17]AXH46665.1 lysin A [Arthrobacter phage Synepsis]QYC54992.1 endolysin [Arthrobacter p
MTFSSLISGTIPHNNKFSSRQGVPVSRIIQHHFAGSSDGRLRSATEQASSHYVIYNDGSIWGLVPEEYRAWTSGSFEADAPSITYEVQNSSFQINGNDNDPNSWAVSDAAYNSIVRLTADIARRYGFGAVTPTNYQGHRQWYSTACPGGFLWARMDNTRSLANKALTGASVPTPTPSTPPVAGKTVWQLADEVLAGHHGSGDARKISLGNQYDAVQAEINRRLGAVVAAPAAKSVSQLADEVLAGAHGNGDARRASLGNLYDAVQNEINRRLGGGGVAPQGVNISQLADAVMRGEYGSGQDRVNRLGANYAAVQAEVNRRFGGGVAVAAPTLAVNISALADAVLRGEYGNGDDRVRLLGANYAAVQAEINRRYA